MMEMQICEIDAGIAKCVQIALANMAPIVEFDAEFERAARFADKLSLIETEHAVQPSDLRNRGFANADRADGFRLDQRDLDGGAEHTGHGCRSDPAHGPASDDDNIFNVLALHISVLACSSDRAQWPQLKLEKACSKAGPFREDSNSHSKLEFLRHRQIISGAIFFVTAWEDHARVYRFCLSYEWLIGQVRRLANRHHHQHLANCFSCLLAPWQ